MLDISRPAKLSEITHLLGFFYFYPRAILSRTVTSKGLHIKRQDR